MSAFIKIYLTDFYIFMIDCLLWHLNNIDIFNYDIRDLFTFYIINIAALKQ